jgi:ABC-2 type transport system permease protein
MTRFAEETWAQLKRWLIRLRREPFNLAFALLQPLLFFIFFGGAFERMVQADLTATSYRAYILAGVVTLTVVTNSLAGGIPLLFDKENGFLGRLLVAPISRASILAARFLFVNLVSGIQTLLFLGLAWLFGIHVGTGLLGIVIILGLGFLLGSGVTIISLWLAFKLRGHGDFFALLGTITPVLTFVSTAFVPLERMPGWMAWMARLNPLTYAVDGMRQLIIEPTLDLGSLALQAAGLTLFAAAMIFLGVRALRQTLAV